MSKRPFEITYLVSVTITKLGTGDMYNYTAVSYEAQTRKVYTNLLFYLKVPIKRSSFLTK